MEQSSLPSVNTPKDSHSFWVLIGVILSSIFFIFGVWTINDYGVTWDEPENFDVGNIYLRFFESFDFDYLHFDATNPFYEETLRPYWSINSPSALPPVANIFAALTKQVFYDKLQIMEEFPAYHLSVLLLASIFVFVFYLFILKRLGVVTAIISTISLMLFPYFLGNSHNDIKDIPLLIFFSLAIFSFYLAYEKGSKFWIVASGIILGLAINIKINALFLPLIFLIWMVAINYRKNNLSLSVKEMVHDLSLFMRKWFYYPLAAVLTIFLTWPLLWTKPGSYLLMIKHFVELVKVQRMEVLYFGSTLIAGQNLPWHYAFTMLAVVTPLIILILGIIGLYLFVRHYYISKDTRGEGLFLLILIWFFVPLLRVMFTDASYGGIKHYGEVVPALCIMAGYAGSVIYEKLFSLFRFRELYRHIVLVVLFILLFLPLLIANIQIHPYQSSFYNALVGGPKGVYDQRWSTVYNIASYKQGAEWLNENATENSKVKTEFSLYTSDLLGLYLREDLLLATSTSSDFDYYVAPYELDELITPLYIDSALGAPVLVIYKGSDIRKSLIFNSTFDIENGSVHLYRSN